MFLFFFLTLLTTLYIQTSNFAAELLERVQRATLDLEEKGRTLTEKERELVVLRRSLSKTDGDLKEKSSEVETLKAEKAAIQSQLDDARRSLDDERRKLREADDRVRKAEEERDRVQETCSAAQMAKEDMFTQLRKAEEDLRLARAQADGAMQEAVDRAVAEHKASQAFAEEFEEAAAKYFLRGAKRMMDELVDKCGFKKEWDDLPIVSAIREMSASSAEENLSLDDAESVGPAASKGKATQGKGKNNEKAGGPSEPGSDFSSEEDLPTYEPPRPIAEQEGNNLPLADDQGPPPPEIPAVPQHPSEAEGQLPKATEDQPPLPAEDHPPPPAEDLPPPPAED